MKLRVLFADDEEMARRRLRRLLAQAPDVEVVSECKSGGEALVALEKLEVDLALLDVHMGRVSGLEVSDLAAELGVEVIFTTAHQEHALEAFEKGAIDYLLKPIEEARLLSALDRARARRPLSSPVSASPVGLRPQERFALEVRGEVLLLRPEEVSHALLDGPLVSLFVGNDMHLTELSLSDLLRLLPHLLRVHRRALVALDHIEKLRPQPTGGYLAITRAGAEVPVSRQSARELRRRLGLS